MITLDPKNYYDLTYSLLSENKIREVTGLLRDNTMDNVKTLYEEVVNSWTNSDGTKTVMFPLDVTYMAEATQAGYVNRDLSSGTSPYYEGKFELLSFRKHFKFVTNEPCKFHNMIISYKGLQWSLVTDSTSDVVIFTTNTDVIIERMAYMFTNEDRVEGLRNIPPFNGDLSEFVQSYDENNVEQYISSNHMSGIDTSYHDGGFGSYDYEACIKCIDSYTFEGYVDILELYNMNYQRTDLNVSMDSYKYIDVNFNYISEANITIQMLTARGETITFDYYVGKDYNKYKTTFNNDNELITNVSYINNKPWDEEISNILISKFTNGKLWIQAKVTNSFIVDNSIHIDSIIQIKTLNGKYINKNGTTCSFKVKNIELVYEKSKCYYNIVVMEV